MEWGALLSALIAALALFGGITTRAAAAAVPSRAAAAATTASNFTAAPSDTGTLLPQLQLQGRFLPGPKGPAALPQVGAQACWSAEDCGAGNWGAGQHDAAPLDLASSCTAPQHPAAFQDLLPPVSLGPPSNRHNCTACCSG